MSTEQQPENENTTDATENNSVEAAKEGAANALASALALKESNPKVFYGAIAAVVILLLIMMFSGGSSKPQLAGNISKDLSVGQTYTLQGANSYSENSTVSLAVAPGTVTAFGDDEEESEKSSCKQIKQGTRAKVIDIQQTAGVSYVNVEVLEGACSGRKGWALSIDMQ